MFITITQLCGGIGLFLLGMALMTDSLKEMAGETIRVWLSKFTGSTFKAVITGMVLTLIVQSSTATTLATIGFVSAGVLSFAHAIGVVIGASLGSTSTGWMVAFLGVKFSIAQIALPLIALGAILKLFAKGRLALLGLTISGFGLIFFGIEILQIAMSDFASKVNLAQYSSDTFFSQCLIIVIGIVMTILMQSSSAAVTATIAALATNAIDLQQALCLVIGLNIGTVFTSVLAGISSTVDAKRTAAVHVFFKIIAAIFALFILMPVFLWLYKNNTYVAAWDSIILVAAYHTCFSLAGILIFLPFLKKIEQLIVSLIPDRSPSILKLLDKTSLSVPALAISAANKVMNYCLYDVLSMVKKAIQDGTIPSSYQLAKIDEFIMALKHYLDAIPILEEGEEQRNLVRLLRIMVYLKVLRSDLEAIESAEELREEPSIYQLGLDYINILNNYLNQIEDFSSQKNMADLNMDLFDLKQWSENHRTDLRAHIVSYAHDHQLSAAKSLELFAAQRWLDRLIAHSQRLANVLGEQ
ncbi:Na/Pi cotransporter family protein [Acinetobacter stercoris]|nr:Na/Pi symporter [Acinetobacter stercoris]